MFATNSNVPKSYRLLMSIHKLAILRNHSVVLLFSAVALMTTLVPLQDGKFPFSLRLLLTAGVLATFVMCYFSLVRTLSPQRILILMLLSCVYVSAFVFHQSTTILFHLFYIVIIWSFVAMPIEIEPKKFNLIFFVIFIYSLINSVISDPVWSIIPGQSINDGAGLGPTFRYRVSIFEFSQSKGAFFCLIFFLVNLFHTKGSKVVLFLSGSLVVLSFSRSAYLVLGISVAIYGMLVLKFKYGAVKCCTSLLLCFVFLLIVDPSLVTDFVDGKSYSDVIIKADDKEVTRADMYDYLVKRIAAEFPFGTRLDDAPQSFVEVALAADVAEFGYFALFFPIFLLALFISGPVNTSLFFAYTVVLFSVYSAAYLPYGLTFVQSLFLLNANSIYGR